MSPPDNGVRAGAGPDPGAVAVGGLSLSWPGPDPGAPTVVFDGLDLDVAPGSFVSVVGPSGCGKSTLLRVLAGLLVPDAGSARVGGVDVVGRPGACAWLPQRDNLLPWRRVLANATLGAELGGTSRAEAEARARPLLERFGLAGFERSWPAQLSGGMRQRLAVLRTFLVDAPVLLLDEPFGALDALTRRRMQTWLQEVWLADAAAHPEPGTTPDPGARPASRGGGAAGGGGGSGHRRTVLLVTHDVEEALLLADRVIVLSERPGRIVADLAVGFARPRDAALVGDPAFVAARAELLGALGA